MPGEELFYLSVTELAKRIEAKKLSPVELTQIYLDRSQRLGARFNAYATLTPEIALEQAKTAEKELGSKLPVLRLLSSAEPEIQSATGRIVQQWSAAGIEVKHIVAPAASLSERAPDDWDMVGVASRIGDAPEGEGSGGADIPRIRRAIVQDRPNQRENRSLAQASAGDDRLPRDRLGRRLIRLSHVAVREFRQRRARAWITDLPQRFRGLGDHGGIVVVQQLNVRV